MRSERPYLLLSALAVALGFAALYCYLAFTAGQDVNWDFYNYHHYNAYAFLNDRFWFDIQPAQRQTYLSPFLDIPFYWLTQSFGVLAASLVYALFQSLQAPFLFSLSFVVIRDAGVNRAPATWIALMLAGIGVLAPLGYQQIGTTWGDSTTATLVIAGLALYYLAFSREFQPKKPQGQLGMIAAAGALFGLAVGLKLTNGTFAIAMMACIGLFPGSPVPRIRNLAVFGLSSLAVFLLSYGYWGWFLYDQLQNPFFPQFNHIFQSDYISPVALTVDEYKATRISRILFYPFYFNVLTAKINGQQFMDLRIPIVYLLMAGTALVAIVLLIAKKRFTGSRPRTSLLVFFVVAYIIWLLLFSIIRFALVLEVLAPLTALCAISVWTSNPRRLRMLALGVLIIMAASTALLTQGSQPRGPRAPWTDTPFEVQVPYQDLEDAMVVVSGGQAMAFIIPGLPTSTRFVRVDSNLFYNQGFRSLEERFDSGIGRRLGREIGQHQGHFFTLFSDGEQAYADSELTFFGLVRQAGTCRPILSKGGPPLILCRARRENIMQ
jgi:hypothetical protein